MISRLSLLLLTLVSVPGLSQDLASARKQFSQTARSKDLVVREAGIEALVQAKDAGAEADLLKAITRAEKAHRKLMKKVVSLGGKRKGIWKSIDRQGSAGRPVSRGSAQGAMKKEEALRREFAKLARETDFIESWHRALLAGHGRLLENLPVEQRRASILRLSEEAEKTSKLEVTLRIIQIFRSANASEARESLSELALRSERANVRTAAMDALGDRAEASSIGAITQGLQDDAWTVRISAMRALKRIPSARSVEPLIVALGSAKGRALDEVQEALEDITGITFFDNQTLWRDWWKKNGGSLEKLIADLDAPGATRRTAGALRIGDTGFLAGTLKILAVHGLGLPTPLSANRKKEPGKEPDSEDARSAREMALEAVPLAISGRPKRIRDRALRRMLSGPYRQTGDFEARAQYLELMGLIASPSVLRVLTRLVGPNDARDPNTKKPYDKDKRQTLRKIAVTGLGHQDKDSAVRSLGDILDEPSHTEELKLLAVNSLKNLQLRRSVDALIRAIPDFKDPIRSKLVEALVDLTGQAHGDDYRAWRKWFRGLDADWKPRGAEANDAVAKKGIDRPGGTTFYGIETRSKHIVYIIDVSGSMNENDAGGAGETRMNVARQELIASIRSLPSDATFNIIFYNHEHSVWQKKMVVANKKNKGSATKWAKSKLAMGATNIFDPLEHAFQLAGRGTHDKRYGLALDTIFFLSDGQPNRGRIISPQEIIKEVVRMNELKKVKIHTVGIGGGHNGSFMRRLAEITEGSYISRK